MSNITVDNNKIRMTRIYKNIPLSEFAKAIGISYGSMSHIELGTRNPSLKVLNKIAEYLNIPISELLLGSYSSVESITDGNAPYVSSENKEIETCSTCDFSLCLYKEIKADYAIKVNTNALMPFVSAGSCVFIKENAKLKNNDTVLLKKDSNIYYGRRILNSKESSYEINKKVLSDAQIEKEGYTVIGKIVFIK